MLPAANREAKPIVLASPGSCQVGESGQQQLPLVRSQPADEIRPLAEHVEQVQHCQHNVQIEAGEQQTKMLHRAVEVAGEGVLDQQGGEVQGPEHLGVRRYNVNALTKELVTSSLRCLASSPGWSQASTHDPGALLVACKRFSMLFFCNSVSVHLLQDVIAEVKDVDPVVKLTFACNTDFFSDDQEVTCITMISKQKQR